MSLLALQGVSPVPSHWNPEVTYDYLLLRARTQPPNFEHTTSFGCFIFPFSYPQDITIRLVIQGRTKRQHGSHRSHSYVRTQTCAFSPSDLGKQPILDEKKINQSSESYQQSDIVSGQYIGHTSPKPFVKAQVSLLKAL